MSPWGEELIAGGHFNDLYSPYFLPGVMMKFTRKVKGHFVTIIEVRNHLKRHESSRSQEAYHGLSHDGVTWDKVRRMTLRLLDAIRRWGPLVHSTIHLCHDVKLWPCRVLISVRGFSRPCRVLISMRGFSRPHRTIQRRNNVFLDPDIRCWSFLSKSFSISAVGLQTKYTLIRRLKIHMLRS